MLDAVYVALRYYLHLSNIGYTLGAFGYSVCRTRTPTIVYT